MYGVHCLPASMHWMMLTLARVIEYINDLLDEQYK